MRIAMRLLVLVLLLLIGVTPAWCALSLTATMLVSPPGYDVHPTGLNINDQACGYLTDVDGNDTAFIWSSATGMVLLGNTRAYGISRFKTVVGETVFVDIISVSIATVWARGSQTWLTDEPSVARAISTLGQVAGEKNSKPVLWEYRQTMQLFGIAGTGSANALNDYRVVVGGFNGDAFAWKNGIVTDLGPGEAFAVDNLGNVAGMAVVSTIELPARWKKGTYFRNILGTLGVSGRALAMNSHNVIVGYGQDLLGDKSAALWLGVGVTSLNSITTGLPVGWHLTKAVAVNDQPKIHVLCEAENLAGDTAAFLLKQP